MTDEKVVTPVVVNGVPPTGDPKFDGTQAWLAAQAAKRAAAPAPKPEAKPEPKPDAAEAKPEAVEAKPVEPAKASKELASKLAGKETPKVKAWDENATGALRKLGMRDEELPKFEALAAENPWLVGFLDGAQKRITKTDADYAALKAGTREPTPGAQRPLAHEQGDQPGSGQVADLFETVTKKLGEELGDENALLLRQAFGALEAQNNQLREELHGYTRSVQVERQEAEIEAMVQKSRSALREEFPGIDDEARFEAVATELAGMRPSEITPEAITQAMRKAARVVFFDDLKADAQAVAARHDTKRKTRLAETAPGGSTADTDEPVLDEFEISLRSLKMQTAGEPKERISRWVQNQHERRRKANHR